MTHHPQHLNRLYSLHTQLSREEVIESIRADYAANYFISGVGEMAGARTAAHCTVRALPVAGCLIGYAHFTCTDSPC